MNNTLLQLLIAERDKLNRAIEALGSEPKKRGRPPGRRSRRSPARPAKSGRRGMTAAARKAQSERMKAYWAQRRKKG